MTTVMRLIFCSFVAVFFLAASVTAQPSMSVTRIATGLTRPVYVTVAPGDSNRLFIVEQRSGSTGRIKILNLTTGTVNVAPFLSIANVSTGSEQGLLGLAFHPDYQKNRRFYVNLTNAAGTTEIREYQRDAVNPDLADAATVRTLRTIAQPFTNHNGGWMGFGPDGYLYIATGDGGSGGDPGNNAQTITNNLLGKLLRIDPLGNNGPGGQYGIPATNPFVGVAGDDEIWCYGLRNPWRCSFDWLTGDLYIGDVGQNTWEEIDVQPASSTGGENYGWRIREGANGGALPGAIDPIYDYSHGGGTTQGFSVTGGYVYRGPIAVLQGHYFFADYVNARIWSLKWNGDAPAQFDGENYTDFIDWTSLITASAGSIAGISSFGEDASGNLYIVDLPGGEVFRVDGATIPTLAEAMKLLDGRIAFGQLSDAGVSDNVYFGLEPVPTTNPRKQKIDLVLQSTANTESPAGFSFRVEAHMQGGPVGDVVQEVRLFNYQNGQYELLDTRAASSADTVVTVTPAGDLSRFVQAGTREITASVIWSSPEFTGSPFNWTVDLDQAVWPVTD